MSLNLQQFRELIGQRLAGRRLMVVSNREPYIHSYVGDEIQCTSPASGLVTALEPIMRACGGTWVAEASGDADSEVVDEQGRVLVPPEEGSFVLKRLWLSKEEEEGYYYGFANQALWPLCHHAFVRPRFNAAHWRTYVEVNRKFAQALLEEIGSDPALVFIQDYHFALLPKMLKEQRPDLMIAHFWHIPWPNPEAFRICPWGDEILEGLLGNDVLGFHIQHHCNNFLSTVEQRLETIVDYEHFAVQRQGHRTFVRPFPISVDFEAVSREAESDRVVAEAERLRHALALQNQLVVMGVDRIDYTKGIPERLLAIDRLFEKHPEYQRRLTFLQVGPISRIHINEYKSLNDEIYHLMVETNLKYGAPRWAPIRVLKNNYPRSVLLALFRLADVCIVSSLHDGMNLVAKEFVSARPDGNAALVLSRFTGASREFADAFLVNPYDADGFADAIKAALELSPEERQERMARMRRALEENNIYDWAAAVLTELCRLY